MKTDVVLLPGLHGSTALFDAFIALAPAWARCRALPLPLGPDQSFDALAEALAPTLRPLEGFVLFGESFSGPVAARLSRLLGPKVALLVLCNPLTQISISFPSRVAASFIRSRWIPPWIVALAMTGGNRSLGAAVLREVRTVPPDVLTKRLAAASRATGADLVAQISAPLLTILGTSDRLISASTSRSLIAGVPYSTITEIPAPHLAAQSNPAEVWAAISEEFEHAA